MSDKEEYARIATMSLRELLDYVLAHPEYLTDRYYKGFDTAIYARAAALEAEFKGGRPCMT